MLNISLLFGVFFILSVFMQNTANINEISEENKANTIDIITLKIALQFHICVIFSLPAGRQARRYGVYNSGTIGNTGYNKKTTV